MKAAEAGAKLTAMIQALKSALSWRVGSRLLLGAAVVTIITLLYPSGILQDYDYSEGSIWNDEDLIAPFSFPIYRDPETVAGQQQEAAIKTPRSFDKIAGVEKRAKDSLKTILAVYARICDKEFAASDRFSPEDIAQKRLDTLNNRAAQAAVPKLRKSAWEQLLSLRASEVAKGKPVQPFTNLHREVSRIIETVYAKGILDSPKSAYRQPQIAVRDGAVERLTPISQFLDRNEIGGMLANLYENKGGREREEGALEATVAYAAIQPDLLFNEGNTMIAIQDAIDKVPRTDGMVKQNERIVSRHERVTGIIKSKIDSYIRAKRERGGDVNQFAQLLGKAGHTIAILSLFVIYLFQFRKQIMGSFNRLLLISLLIVFEALLANISLNLPVTGPLQFLILVPAASMLLTIIFDSRVGFYGTVVVSFLIGALRGNDYSIILASVVAGSLSVYTVRDIKHRTQIFRSLAFIFTGYAFTIVIDGMQRAMAPAAVGTELVYALANAVISPVLTFGLLIFFERVFRITTDLTLLELSDFTHPLLRELSARAPGTFHHSIVMGTLAEAAAKAIGANPTLARVGAYYHDVGKIAEPEFFVENQQGASNIHNTLPPKESARKIIDHVDRGVELAREYGLPDRVIDFIPGHHGTTTVQYFYEKEKQRAGTADAGEFKYHGPTPEAKEVGIVMLADTIEAAARTVDDPSVENFEKLIDSVISKRMAEGQLRNCDLTFRDLEAVKRSFTNILMGIHHSRIKYPDQTPLPPPDAGKEKTAKHFNFPSTAEALARRIKKLGNF